MTQETEQERVLLVGVCMGEMEEMEHSLDELAELADTAGAMAVGRIVQNREQVHPGTYVGKGKLEEIREALVRDNASGIICDDELSPAQLGNMREILQTKIMDRTLVILDIFAARASTSEGKLQVELAQLKYRQSRLAGYGKEMSRLGGGIGTRGPGEKKLEVDRRLIGKRISHLNRELKEVKSHRRINREQRSQSGIPVVAIVGYTNAGKSTLLNQLTGAQILAEDKLFATLDPTTRRCRLPGGQEILLTDTVGFIRKLPHHLIDAFRSTLEEARYADVILHVADASNPQVEEQMETVYQTLDALHISGLKEETDNRPIVTAFNKQDKLGQSGILRDQRADERVAICAKNGEGMEQLLKVLEKLLRERKTFIRRLFPYKEAGRVQNIRKYGELLKEEYRQDGIYVEGYVPLSMR